MAVQEETGHLTTGCKEKQLRNSKLLLSHCLIGGRVRTEDGERERGGGEIVTM